MNEEGGVLGDGDLLGLLGSLGLRLGGLGLLLGAVGGLADVLLPELGHLLDLGLGDHIIQLA